MPLLARWVLVFCGALPCFASAALAQAPAAPDSARMPGPPAEEGRARLMFGKITKISDAAIVVERAQAGTLTVNITAKTEFRKDRQPAKLADFKVGDMILIRGQENADHTVTAEMIVGRTGGGPGGPPAGGLSVIGILGKDFLVGEITALHPPKLTIKRVDNVSQTIELNEGTSLRKGRDSATMADLQTGDHVMVRGGLENGVFVPKTVIVFTAEQWKHLQEFRNGNGAQGAPQGNAPAGAGAPAQEPPKQNSPEQKN